jgi:hypothetical protein
VTLFWIFIGCAVGMVVAQDLVPGSAVFHYGWYNAVCVSLLVLAAIQKHREALALFGCAVLVFAGAASGLMGPDTHTVVGAPGASVRDDETGGEFLFPLYAKAVQFQNGRRLTAIGDRRRYIGSFVMWQTPRDVVYVQAADLRGNHLTITQPVNASFLSPVLLMQQSTTIAGMAVRFDTFSIPAAQRNVKAVLFSIAQAAQLRTDPPIAGRPAVLFDVSDMAQHDIPGGIGIVASGAQKRIGGLILGASIGSYPAVVVASAPYAPVLIIGLALCLTGAVRSILQRRP